MIHTTSKSRSGGALLLAAAVTLLAMFAGASPAHARAKRPYVQKRYLQIVAGTSVAVTFRKKNVAGDLIVAYVVWDNADAVTISDTLGNGYASAVGPTQTPADGVPYWDTGAPGLAGLGDYLDRPADPFNDR